jgi:hypothetical protein
MVSCNAYPIEHILYGFVWKAVIGQIHESDRFEGRQYCIGNRLLGGTVNKG